MTTKRIVHLRIYKGKELNYDSNGNVRNENQLVKLPFGSQEYRNYLKHIIANGICSVIIEKVLESKKSGGFKEAKPTAEETAEVKKASILHVEKRSASEAEKENIELRKEIEALRSGKADNGPMNKESNNDTGKTGQMNPDQMSLNQLRQAFPKVKANSKEAFLEKLKSL